MYNFIIKKSEKNLADTKKVHNFAAQKQKNNALWCNGSTSDSGSACEGSNPSKATQRKSQLINFNQLRFFSYICTIPLQFQAEIADALHQVALSA